MRYVSPGTPAPTESSPSPAATALRCAVHDLRAAAEHQRGAHPAWATRSVWDAPLSTALGASAERAPDPHLAGLLAQLRAVTTRYVCGLRAAGVRPEQMLVQVKAFVRDAMTADGWLDPAATRALTAEVVRWSIVAYYDA